MKQIIFFLLIVCLCSCRTTKSTIDWERQIAEKTELVNNQQSKLDSLAHVIRELNQQKHEYEERDSVYQHTHITDSTVVKDSVYTKEFADGSHETTRIREIWHNTTVHDTIVDHSSKRELQSEISRLTDSLSYYRDYCAELQQTEKSDSVKTVIKEKVVKTSVSFWSWWWIILILLVIGFVAGFIVRGKIRL